MVPTMLIAVKTVALELFVVQTEQITKTAVTMVDQVHIAVPMVRPMSSVAKTEQIMSSAVKTVPTTNIAARMAQIISIAVKMVLIMSSVVRMEQTMPAAVPMRSQTMPICHHQIVIYHRAAETAVRGHSVVSMVLKTTNIAAKMEQITLSASLRPQQPLQQQQQQPQHLPQLLQQLQQPQKPQPLQLMSVQMAAQVHIVASMAPIMRIAACAVDRDHIAVVMASLTIQIAVIMAVLANGAAQMAVLGHSVAQMVPKIHIAVKMALIMPNVHLRQP